MKPGPLARQFLLRFAADYLAVATIVSDRVADLKRVSTFTGSPRELQDMKDARFARARTEVMDIYNLCFGQGWVQAVAWEQKPRGEPPLLTDICELTARGREALGLPNLTDPKQPTPQELETARQVAEKKQRAWPSRKQTLLFD